MRCGRRPVDASAHDEAPPPAPWFGDPLAPGPPRLWACSGPCGKPGARIWADARSVSCRSARCCACSGGPGACIAYASQSEQHLRPGLRHLQPSGRDPVTKKSGPRASGTACSVSAKTRSAGAGGAEERHRLHLRLNRRSKETGHGARDPAFHVKPRGFAAMSLEQHKQIASQGGKAAHAAGTAHRYTAQTAAEAGANGGRSTAASTCASSAAKAGTPAARRAWAEARPVRAGY